MLIYSFFESTWTYKPLPAFAIAGLQSIDCQASRIALGSLDTVFNERAERGWLLETATAARRRLTGPDRLLDKWVTNYPTILRPRLDARRFAAPEPDWWRDMSLAELKSVYWGGEVAAEMVTAYLRPETQTLYVVPEHS